VTTAPENPANTPERPAARAPFPHSFMLRCADAHPVRCGEEWHSSSPDQLVATATAHGTSAHGFTPAWYSPQRIAAIMRAVADG
jgi:hypothetical protein